MIEARSTIGSGVALSAFAPRSPSVKCTPLLGSAPVSRVVSPLSLSAGGKSKVREVALQSLSNVRADLSFLFADSPCSLVNSVCLSPEEMDSLYLRISAACHPLVQASSSISNVYALPCDYPLDEVSRMAERALQVYDDPLYFQRSMVYEGSFPLEESRMAERALQEYEEGAPSVREAVASFPMKRCVFNRLPIHTVPSEVSGVDRSDASFRDFLEEWSVGISKALRGFDASPFRVENESYVRGKGKRDAPPVNYVVAVRPQKRLSPDKGYSSSAVNGSDLPFKAFQ